MAFDLEEIYSPGNGSGQGWEGARGGSGDPRGLGLAAGGKFRSKCRELRSRVGFRDKRFIALRSS